MEVILARDSIRRRLVTWDSDMNSEPFSIEGGSVAILKLPANFTGTAITVDVWDDDDDTWSDLYFDGTELSIPVVAGKSHVMPPELFAANGIVRLTSNASETCVGKFRPVR